VQLLRLRPSRLKQLLVMMMVAIHLLWIMARNFVPILAHIEWRGTETRT
jgi:hypothetical protein